MAATHVTSFNFDKENDVNGSQLTARTPHSVKSLRLPSGSTLDDGPLKPGQRSLSNSTPNLNRAALQNVKNTPLLPAGSGSTFKTPVAVRPKVKQSPAVDSVDPMTRGSTALPLDDEDYVGEFVAPSDRVTAYLDTLIKCNPLALWGFPCIPFTGSTSDDEEDDAFITNTNRRKLNDSVKQQQVIGEQQLLLHDDLVDSSELNMDDLLPIANDAPAATSTTSSFKH